MKVDDTTFSADLTIIEETAEFLDRVKNGGKLPLLTSCCPAWVKFVGDQFPRMSGQCIDVDRVHRACCPAVRDGVPPSSVAVHGRERGR